MEAGVGRVLGDEQAHPILAVTHRQPFNLAASHSR